MNIFGIIGYEVKCSDINSNKILHFNSPGGDVYEAIAIANEIKKDSNRIAINEGIVAGSALLPFVVCKDRLLINNAMFRFCEPFILYDKQKKDLYEKDHQSTDLMSEVSLYYFRIIADVIGLTIEQVKDFCKQEKTVEKEEALEIGLINFEE